MAVNELNYIDRDNMNMVIVFKLESISLVDDKKKNDEINNRLME